MNSALTTSTFARRSAIALVLLGSAAYCVAQNSSSNQSSNRPSTGGAYSQSSPSTSATSSSAMSSSGEKVGWMDRHWVSKTADGGTDEVALAQLAAQRATNPEVRQFAEQLVKDHTAVNQELTQIATAKNIKLDKDDGHGRAYRRLNGKSGADFDQTFVEHMIDGHEDAIRSFEKAAKDAKDPEIRGFASKHLADLREHLQKAQSLRSSLMPTGRENANSPGSYNSTPSTTTPSTSPSKTQSTNTGGTNPDAPKPQY